MELPKQLIQFIINNSGITYDYISYLPNRYADIDNFNKMQEGYRFNSITNECLVSRDLGCWHNEWYVFAVNGMDDPFFIDISQGDVGFPVYFSWHGAGVWTQIKIADTLDQFEQALKVVKDYEIHFPFELKSLPLNINLDNEFWDEINQTCKEYAFDNNIPLWLGVD